MSAIVDDLLAQLRGEETRRGAGREVDKHPTPSTRGIAERSWIGGRQQTSTDQAERLDALRTAKDRLIAGVYDVDDVVLVREATRMPWTLTYGEPCPDDCPHRDRPRHWNGVPIGDSICDVDGTCWTVEQAAHDQFRREHDGRSATAAHARFRRGVPVETEIAEVVELPIAKLAKGRVGKVGHPPKMTDEQIDAALDELANDPTVTLTALARREWQGWGFKNEASCMAALRRYRSLRDTARANHDVTQEVAA